MGAAIGALAVVMASPAAADDQVDPHLARGLERYRAHDFDAASREFAAGYAAQPSPIVLYNWAQAERLAGRCGTALALYRQLATQPLPQGYADAVAGHIATCEKAAAPVVVAAPPVVAQQPPPGPAATPVEHAAWYRDAWADGLFAGGLAAGVVAVAYYVQSSSELDKASDAARYAIPAREAFYADARADRRVAQWTAGASAVLGLAGAARLIWHERPRRAAQVGVARGDRGAVALTLAGDF